MGSIRDLRNRLILFFIFLSPLRAQSGLDLELRNLEDRLRRPSSESARLEDLGRLAFLRGLSGDQEGAASSWELAAGGGNSQALLRGAACFMALGDWERAEAAIKEVLLQGGAGEDRLQACFLRAQMEGLQSGGTNTAALVSLLEDPAYRDYWPRICFGLWKFTGRESWRKKLAEEFPRSPEGRIAAGTESSGGIRLMAAPSPVWLLFAAFPPSAASPPARPAASPSPPPQGPPPPLPGETLLQAGLFSREANARALLERLRAAGFSALSGRQTRAGADYTVVYVRPGPDINRSIRELKAAGFDSFPVSL
jgi:hypothetical protein